MQKFLTLIILLSIISLNKGISEELFVVSDVYGILPNGACSELVGGDFGNLKQRNIHWDAASKTIRMYAARNEEVAVQIAIPRKGGGFRARMSDLTGPATIGSERATFSAMAWVNHTKIGFCPDLVIPLDGSINGIRRFDVPISFEGIPQPGNTVGVMLFEIWVPKDVIAGNYRGTIGIMENETEIEKLNVELTVYDFSLPAMPTFAFELLSYGMPSEDLGAKAYVNAGDGLGAGAKEVPQRTKDIDYQVYKLAIDNRCFVNTVPYSSQRGHPRYAYPIEGRGQGARIMSYEEWDDYFSPILNGEVNKFGEPPQHFILPFNVNYPYLCESEPKNQFNFLPFKNTIASAPLEYPELREFELSYKTIAEQFIDHFTKKGWTKTQFEVFNNQKANPDRNRIPWKLDEPTDWADYMGLHYILRVARWAFESAPQKGIQIRNRIDVGHFNCDRFLTADRQPTRCYKAKGYNKFNADKYLKPVVDHWVIGSSHVQAAQHTLNEYEGENTKLMTYGSAGTTLGIGLHYGQFAGEGFLAARMGLEGKVIFKVGLNTADPNKQEPGSYAGNTFYSGLAMGFEGALPTHRLKLWRNAVNDFEYITLAKQIDEAATDEIIEGVVSIGASPSDKYKKDKLPREFFFTNNVEDIVRAKAKLAGIITGQQIAGMEIEGYSERYNPCGSPDQIVDFD